MTKSEHTLRLAIIAIGGSKAVAELTGVSRQSVEKWLKNGLPRTEWTGETSYTDKISKAAGKRSITKKHLLDLRER